MFPNVTSNDLLEYAVRPFAVTVTGWYVVPIGTVTVNEVVEADVTGAFTAPKYTMLAAGTGLKFVPVMVTIVPIGPEVGVKEVMVGGCAMLAKKAISKELRKIAFFIVHGFAVIGENLPLRWQRQVV